MKDFFDLIVLGAGSGGLAAAKRAARHGARVAIVEGDRVGGTCVIRGCVPKKLLVYGALFRKQLEVASSYGVEIGGLNFQNNIFLSNVRNEVDRLNRLHVDFLANAGVELFQAWGSFSGQNSIDLLDSNSKKPSLNKIHGKRILIAVGGRPWRPEIPGASLGWTSDDMFLQEDLPEKMVVVGGGFIACEFSCILNSLGVKVSQFVRSSSLLRSFDSELSSHLEHSMRESGIDFHFDTVVSSIDGCPGDLIVKTSSATFLSGGILFATGRKPFLDNLNLNVAGVDVHNGRIEINKMHETNVPNIYALGDVTDRWNLTPVAIDEGRALADRIFGGICRDVNYQLVPRAVFSDPEIATIGLSEVQAIESLGASNVQIYRSMFRPMSQSLHKSGPKCLLKLVVDSRDEKVIGCHMLGEHAAEIIQMASIAIGMGATKKEFDNTMALHPTIAEEFVTMA
ncbi:glutathione-disulfide reductase [Prochlorococcus sp. MIT 1300]|uniref:glutathione-disulfide reductase n=1 Tax=Prochlorococcus sp. MIT 1300 TaxID=3096218 RepID=UPI002A748BD9|nr:glutathione-disulfide reductase [Prochlorococcus sp. MIT 1300]